MKHKKYSLTHDGNLVESTYFTTCNRGIVCRLIRLCCVSLHSFFLCSSIVSFIVFIVELRFVYFVFLVSCSRLEMRNNKKRRRKRRRRKQREYFEIEKCDQRNAIGDVSIAQFLFYILIWSCSSCFLSSVEIDFIKFQRNILDFMGSRLRLCHSKKLNAGKRNLWIIFFFSGWIAESWWLFSSEMNDNAFEFYRIKYLTLCRRIFCFVYIH